MGSSMLFKMLVPPTRLYGVMTQKTEVKLKCYIRQSVRNSGSLILHFALNPRRSHSAVPLETA